MTITKQVSIDKIEVLEDSSVQVREATRIIEDGAVLTTTYHRHVVAPGDPLDGEDPRVKSICEVVHTPEVIEKYQAKSTSTSVIEGELK